MTTTIKDILALPMKRDKLNIILIAHVREPRGVTNHKQLSCSETEKFSTDEFYEIYSGIVNAGYFIKYTFFNELDFIDAYLKEPSKFTDAIVFNLTRNGLADNKKALIPAFCEMVSIPYTTSGSFACSMARNKVLFSSILHSREVRLPRTWNSYDALRKSLLNMQNKDLKIIKKPISESASQGIDEDSIISIQQLHDANNDEQPCFYQEYIEGYECEVPVIKFGNEILCLDPVEIDLGSNSILTYENSFNDNYTFKSFDSKLTPELINKIKESAIDVFQCLNMDIYGRVDFRVTKEGKAYLIDIATMPYITKHSSYNFAFNKMNLQYHDIFDVILKSVCKKYCIPYNERNCKSENNNPFIKK